MSADGDTLAVLDEACSAAGLDAHGATLIRSAENTLFRLPGAVVARVSRTGQAAAARKEVRVSRWLASRGLPVVHALTDLDQPVVVRERAVTFWRELPEYRYATTAELAATLRRLHDLPAPDFDLPPLQPFVRLRERITEAALTHEDRAWLLAHLRMLERHFADLPTGRPWCAVHGDAWAGNLAVTAQGPVLLDLERFTFGPPEWDLTAMAVDYATFASMTPQEWDQLCRGYGYDVTTWAGYPVLRDVRELRKVTFALQLTAQFAGDRPDIAEQARYRLACIRGEAGPRPWIWRGLP